MQKSTSKELWDAAKELSQVLTQIQGSSTTKERCRKQEKGGMKMEEYLIKMKTLSDNLALAGSPMPLNDLVTQILSGLDTEYTPIVVQLCDKESISWIELQTTLLTFESRLEQLNTYQTGNFNANQVTAHTATTKFETKPTNSNYGRSQNRNYNNYNRGSRGRFQGRAGRINGNRLSCQLCGKTGHGAAVCWNRFHHDFMGSE